MSNKLIILGVDAMDYRLIERFDMPNFKSLKTGTKLQTTIPPETPVAWSAASTGTNPGKYGIFDFINRDPNTYLPKLNLAEEKRGIIKTEYACAMKGKPFWRTLTENNVPATVIRWPVTFPPEKVNGRMLSGLGVVDVKGLLNKYSYYTTDAGDREEDDTGNIVVVPGGEEFETGVSGPFIMKGGELRDVKAPMKVKLEEDSARLTVNGKEYVVKNEEWSPMISVKFKIYLMNVHGIFKAYVKSVKPFRMYLTSVQVEPESEVYQ